MTSWRTLSRLTPSDSRTPAAMPCALAHEPEEEVLGADVVVVHAAGLVDGELDHALGKWREAHLGGDRLIAAPDDGLDRGAHLDRLDPEVPQNRGRLAVIHAEHAQEQVLGADVAVVEAQGLVLRQGEGRARVVRELIEAIHPAPLRSGQCSRLSVSPFSHPAPTQQGRRTHAHRHGSH